MEHGSSPESSNNPLAARRAGGPHDFVVPSGPLLERDEELECVNAIQRGGVALEAIAGPIVQELIAFASRIDQSLIPLEAIETVVPAVVREQICKQAAAIDRSYGSVGSAIATGLQAQFRTLIDEGAVGANGETHNVVEQAFPETLLKVGFSDEVLGDDSLWDDVAAREKAITTLVTSHYRIAKAIARAAMRQPSDYGELLSDAYLILHRAAISFDGEAGHRFSSYARQALTNELKRQSTTNIRITRYRRAQVREFESAAASLTQERQRSVTSDEVFDTLSYKARTRKVIETVRCLLAAHRRRPRRGEPLIPEEIEERVTSACRDLFDPEESLRLRAACGVLTLQEKKLIVRHYFLGESTRKLAKRYDVTQQAIRRSLAKACRRLADQLDPK